MGVLAVVRVGVWLAQEDGPAAPLPHWVRELIAAVLALVLLAVMVYWFRPGKTGNGGADFRIIAEGAEVQFLGKFPKHLEGLVEDFLLEDCRIDGAYEVNGRWEEGRLAVSVSGAAMVYEQRIRNFLKLNVKRVGD